MGQPRERRVQAGGLSHHVVEWGAEDGTPVLLCHGFLDLAWGWDRVGRRLAAAGCRAVAFDWRGHGETEWVGAGGYYHFPDYVRDLTELVPALFDADAAGPPHLVGHSMGGTAASLFAGTMPDAIRSLTMIEGLGPPAHDASLTPDRFGAWIRDMKKVRSRRANPKAPPMQSLDDALYRMRVQNPELDEAWGLFLAEKGTCPTEDGEGLDFRFDPLHRTTSPVPFRLSAHRAFLQRIAVPTLLVHGSRGYRLPDEGPRAAEIAHARSVEFDDVGHMIHWFADEKLSATLVAFFDDAG
ncbi:MAG: alpha/beta hydrolase [Deltaproteobacteria bacterium]|nr:alpha/beta hydrolase [Deltaproteobacteria bacterium]